MTPSVTFKNAGRTVAWTGADNLLVFAEDNGIDAPFSCGAGVCGTCATALLAGEVTYVEEPLYMPEAGFVLLCCAKPIGSVVLDL